MWFLDAFCVQSLWRHSILGPSWADNFVDLYNQVEEASSHSNCTDGMNSWAAESLPVVRMPGATVVVLKTSQETPDLARTTAGFLLIWSTVPFYSQILLMQLFKTQHSDFEFSCFAFQWQMDPYAATSEDASWSPRIYLAESFLNSSESWDTALTMLSLYLLYFKDSFVLDSHLARFLTSHLAEKFHFDRASEPDFKECELRRWLWFRLWALPFSTFVPVTQFIMHSRQWQ